MEHTLIVLTGALIGLALFAYGVVYMGLGRFLVDTAP